MKENKQKKESPSVFLLYYITLPVFFLKAINTYSFF